MAIADTIREAAMRYGVPPEVLLRIATIESRMNPGAANPRSSAKGLFQFVDDTRAAYGGFDPFDPVASSDAAARLARDNAAVLRRGLGREPTPAEYYLAHQQGAGGALKLLKNPDADAASLVGRAAIGLNAGRSGMTARDFTQHWQAKYEGAAPAAAPVSSAAQPSQLAQPMLAPIEGPSEASAPPVLPFDVGAALGVPLGGEFAPMLAPFVDAPRKPQRKEPKKLDSLGRSLDIASLFRDLAAA